MLEVGPDALTEGSVVGGYRLDRVVGTGGMGVVWAAHEMRSGRIVALKFLLGAHEAGGDKARARFVREARAAMAVTHPNVAKVEAVLETEVGTPFIVMELLDGESMRSFLRTKLPLSVSETARMLLPVVRAVEAAHAKRIVHRDLKPENVFLVRGSPEGPSPDVRVLDFGIAKRLVHDGETASAVLTSTGSILGTPVYMAPEQVFGDQDVDARADVWSLGIMMYECLAGRRPTDGDGFGPIIKRITTARLVPLEEARPDLPLPLVRLVGRMLSRDRSTRPSTTEVANALEAILADAPLPAGPTTSPLAPPLRPPVVTTVPQLPAITTARANDGRHVFFVIAAGVSLLLLGGVVVGVVVVGTLATQAAEAPAPIDGPEARQAEDAAAAAFGARDGKRCLAELDRRDRVARTPADARLVVRRAHCTMLAGDCDGGKAILQKTETVSVVDAAIARYCTGDALSARDALVRNRALLGEPVLARASTPNASCATWAAEERRRLAELGGSADPSVVAIAKSSDAMIVACFVKLGECTGARAAFAETAEGKAAGPSVDRVFREKGFCKSPLDR